MSLALHFPVNLRIATELLGSDSILFPCTVSGVHHNYTEIFRENLESDYVRMYYE